MTVLCTGSEGFIGKHVVKLLTQKGYTVTRSDLSISSDFQNASVEFDFVVHAAAYVSVTESVDDASVYFHNNITKLSTYLKRFSEINPKGKFIFLSTGAVYGSQHLAREHQAHFNHCKNPYAVTKYVGEWLVKQYAKNHLILRLANVIGSGEDRRGEANCMTHFKKDDPIIVYGEGNTRDFIDVETVAEAIVKSIEMDVSGVFNISSGQETKIIDVAKQIGLERKVPVKIMPRRKGEAKYISLDNTNAKRIGLL